MKIYAFEVREDEKESFRQAREKYGLELEVTGDFLSEERIRQLEPDCAVSILGMHQYGMKEMQLFREQGMRYLSTRTIGYNHIDIEAARNFGIHVCSAFYAPNGVAEYTVMMILLCLRNYKQALWRTQVNDYSLGGLMGRELRNMTVGVIGTGRIGAAVVRCLSGFGCRILALGEHRNESISGMVSYTDLETIYRESDIITLHVPLKPETHHMIEREAISRMKPGVILINCARGGLMDIDALISGIENEQIGALGIDCIETEENIVHQNHCTDIIRNPQMAYLRQFKNVIHTQHMAFYTKEAVESMVESSIQGILAMAAGEKFPTQLV